MTMVAEYKPATPKLASSLLAEIEEKLHVPVPKSNKRKRNGRMQSGYRDLDDGVLKGGLAFGVEGKSAVVGLAGGREAGELSLHFLISHLMRNPTALAAIIDTTGAFDILKLYGVILARLQRDDVVTRARAEGLRAAFGSGLEAAPEWLRGLGREEGGSLGGMKKEAGSVEERAERLLSRVRIMRAFDLVGVEEAVEEVRIGLEGRETEDDGDKEAVESTLREARKVRESSGDEGIEEWRKNLEVADSEDEDEGYDEDEDGMLLEPKTPTSERQDGSERKASPRSGEPQGTQEEAVEILIIDNITQVVSPLMKSNYIQAQHLLTSFTQSLSQLTSKHPLLALLINTTISPLTQTSTHQYSALTNPNTSSSTPLYQPRAPTTFSKPHPPQTSQFSSLSHLIPALGPTYPYSLDLSLLVSRLPKTKMDARRYYGSAGVGGAVGLPGVMGWGFGDEEGRRREREKGVRMDVVVEVLGDRWEGRTGGWTVVDL